MARILVDYGEEYLFKTDVSAVASLTLELYNDSTDAISDTDDEAAITTRPDGTDYGSQAASIEVAQINGDWGFQNSAQETFQVGDATTTVDSYFWTADFDSGMDADGVVTHLIATGALSQSYDLSNVDTLNIAAQSAGVTVN